MTEYCSAIAGPSGPSIIGCKCPPGEPRSEEHTSELQSQSNLVCRLLLEKKNVPVQDLHFVLTNDNGGVGVLHDVRSHVQGEQLLRLVLRTSEVRAHAAVSDRACDVTTRA